MPKAEARDFSSSSCNSLILKLKFFLLGFLHRDRRRPPRARVLECFSFKDVKKATDGFRRIVNCDPQGVTYEANFWGGSLSVVREVRGVGKGNEVFYNEVVLLGRLHHRYVVALQGYCVGPRNFLVFEGTAQGSLKEHLNDPLRTPLNWKTRVQVAIGVAAALEYLHRFCDPSVYHISINSSDIILDEKLTPKLTKIRCHSSECDRVETSKLPKESTELIPQFGTLMLELITGQSSMKESTDIIQLMEDSSFSLFMDNMIDPDLGNRYNLKELKSLLALARFCIKADNKSVFTISHIFLYLQRTFSDP